MPKLKIHGALLQSDWWNPQETFRVSGSTTEVRTGYLQDINVKRYRCTNLLVAVDMYIWLFNCLINDIPNVTVEWVDRPALHSIRSWVEIPARRPAILMFSGRPHRCWSRWYPRNILIILYIRSYGSVRFYRRCYAISEELLRLHTTHESKFCSRSRAINLLSLCFMSILWVLIL